MKKQTAEKAKAKTPKSFVVGVEVVLQIIHVVLEALILSHPGGPHSIPSMS